MKRFTLLIFLVFLLTTLQAQRFNGYLVLGVNLTEDKLTELGNSQVGTRLGLNMGLGISSVLSNRWEASMELLYNQNGYFVNPVQVPTIALNKIRLHYIEVPLTFAYRFNIKKDKKASFYKRSIGGGIAHARLFNHKIIAVDGTDVSNAVRFDRENALLFNIVATSFFTESLALNAKGTLSTFGEWTVALRLLYYI